MGWPLPASSGNIDSRVLDYGYFRPGSTVAMSDISDKSWPFETQVINGDITAVADTGLTLIGGRTYEIYFDFCGYGQGMTLPLALWDATNSTTIGSIVTRTQTSVASTELDSGGCAFLISPETDILVQLYNIDNVTTGSLSSYSHMVVRELR